MTRNTRIGLAAVAIAVVAIVIFSGLTDAIGLTSSGSDLNWRGYGKALDEAKQSNKKIIVDVYTNWCGWCKKMDKDVYSAADVQSYLDEHFVTVKLNAEASTKHLVDGSEVSETQIARSWGVNSYPTTVFLAADGSVITVVPGYIKADMFLQILVYVNGEHYKTTKWDDFLRSRQKK